MFGLGNVVTMGNVDATNVTGNAAAKLEKHSGGRPAEQALTDFVDRLVDGLVDGLVFTE